MPSQTKGPALVDGGAVDHLPKIVIVCQPAGVSRPASYTVALPPDVQARTIGRLLKNDLDAAFRAFLASPSDDNAAALKRIHEVMLRCVPVTARSPLRQRLEEFVRDTLGEEQ